MRLVATDSTAAVQAGNGIASNHWLGDVDTVCAGSALGRRPGAAKIRPPAVQVRRWIAFLCLAATLPLPLVAIADTDQRRDGTHRSGQAAASGRRAAEAVGGGIPRRQTPAARHALVGQETLRTHRGVSDERILTRGHHFHGQGYLDPEHRIRVLTWVAGPRLERPDACGGNRGIKRYTPLPNREADIGECLIEHELREQDAVSLFAIRPSRQRNDLGCAATAELPVAHRPRQAVDKIRHRVDRCAHGLVRAVAPGGADCCCRDGHHRRRDQGAANTPGTAAPSWWFGRGEENQRRYRYNVSM